MRAFQAGRRQDQVFCAFMDETPREDLIAYVADFFLQLEDTRWTVIAGQVAGTLIVSVRNLGYSRNAGEFVKKWFNDIGSAGGRRAMAKAVVPMERFLEKYGPLEPGEVNGKLRELVLAFETPRPRRRPGRA